ncbi:MAG: hypothetical protein KJP05_00900, partial [Deltaproteobacteria bacterium]|nr:hypothetical protein [Deltaproteobacteria bacterium]
VNEAGLCARQKDRLTKALSHEDHKVHKKDSIDFSYRYAPCALRSPHITVLLWKVFDKQTNG